MDIEWLLSTLFDASLLPLRAAGNGGSFLCAVLGHVARARGNYAERIIAPPLDERATAG